MVTKYNDEYFSIFVARTPDNTKSFHMKHVYFGTATFEL